MKILMIIIILSVIYVISFRYMYLWVQRQYGKGGEWEGVKVGFPDLFFVVVPFVNTIVAVYQSLVGSASHIRIDYDRFFNIKKN